jgi:small conductance mechanosensitive channel
LESAFSSATSWIGSNVSVLVKILVIIAVAWLFIRVVIKLINGFLKRTVRDELHPSKADREKRIRTLTSITAAIIRCFVWTIAILMILDTLGINIAPLLASAGILGVALGFGTQSLVKDFITGIFIIAENQYRVGDFVEIGGVSGNVESISMRTTVLRDIDGSVHNIPNGSIVISTNRTIGAGYLVVDVTVGTETSLSQAERIINKVGKDLLKSKKMAKMVTEPPRFVRVSEVSDKGVTLKVSGTVATGKQAEVRGVYLTKLQQAMKKEDIKVISMVTSKAKS